jgi:hypothetical protein
MGRYTNWGIEETLKGKKKKGGAKKSLKDNVRKLQEIGY